MLTSALRLHDKVSGEMEEILSTIENSARIILGKARYLSRGLLSLSISNKGLVEALRELCAEMNKMRNWQCHVSAPNHLTIRPDVSTTVYRIAREATENALRHSGASHLHLELAEAEGWLTLTVQDDGVGLAVDYASKGAGLHSMKQAAASVGGTLSIGGQPGHGVFIICSIPNTH
jgi:signal transduction histidine kinase